MDAKIARLHVIVSGRVQGVNFRYYTQRKAYSLGLTGWVANRSDGTVEVIAEGEETDLRALLSFLHRGSPSSRVDRVQAEWSKASGEFDRFRVAYLR